MLEKRDNLLLGYKPCIVVLANSIVIFKTENNITLIMLYIKLKLTLIISPEIMYFKNNFSLVIISCSKYYLWVIINIIIIVQ